MPDGDLLTEVKDKLRITWDNEDGRLRTIIKSSQSYMNMLCGTELDFIEPGQAKELMLERCFYNYHNALHEFEKNYASELTALILNIAAGKRDDADAESQ